MVANQNGVVNGATQTVSTTGKVPDCGVQQPPSSGKVLTLETTNPHILTFREMEYASRGPIVMRAMEMDREMEQAKKTGQTPKVPATIKMNLGDAHAMGQKPISYVRQVLALVSCPELLELSHFPEDIKRKAREILGVCRGGSPGAYSESRGIQLIRQHVATYIETRDEGVPSSADDIILSAGASEGIRACLKLLKSGENPITTTNKASTSSIPKKAGVVVPVPEYPIYSATLMEYNMAKIPYYLEEHETGWEVNIPKLEEIIAESRAHCEPRALVIINPGNPTGHVLHRENIEAIIRLAHKEHLVIFADEVYQNNVYGQKKFLSFKKVLYEMAAPFNTVELISFNSGSKGYISECGLRAGYFEVVNMDPEVKSILVASVAANLCPTVLGQTVIDCLVDPPREGDASFESFTAEKSTILNSLAKRAALVHSELNSIPGVSCAPLDGAMYAFPRIHLPMNAIQAAEEARQKPDVFYGLKLLENTGICVVPGSGMGQQPGTYHFRMTILAPTDQMKTMLERFRNFHLDFMKTYS